MRIDLVTSRPAWTTLVAAAEGDPGATVLLRAIGHPLLDTAWSAGSKAKVRDAIWAVLLVARSQMAPEEATDLLAAFFAHDPVRILPKLDAISPIAVVVAADGEDFDPWPLRSGVRLTGRLIWFLDPTGAVGQVSWPKVAVRERATDEELIARAARLAVHGQITEFRASSQFTDCHLCGKPILDRSHVDHIKPFADLLEEWVGSFGGSAVVAALITNPADGDPIFAAAVDGSWASWHREHAVLAHAHPACNLSRGRRPV